MKNCLAFGTLIFAISVMAPGAHTQTSASPATSIFHVVPTPNGHPKPFQNDLHSVSASSPNDIWAVGQTAIHFDGTKWTAFRMPKIMGDNTSRMGGVVDFAPNNVWAVGLTGISLGNTQQVIEHFDGTAWHTSPGPKFQSGDQPSLESLTAISASDMWAAGFILAQNGTQLLPLFEHFNGTSWKAFEDTSSENAVIFGVSADATNDAWAVGTAAFAQTVIEHYDGTSWSTVPSPSPGFGFNLLFGVTALAPNNVWAVGYYTKDPNSTRPALTLIEHWDGTSWQIVHSPNRGPKTEFQSNQLWGVTAVSATDVWAFGSSFAADGSGQQYTLVEHWDGTKWQIVPSPSPGKVGVFKSDILFGGTVIPQGNLWFVGNKFGRTLALNATGQ
jgi:hypothetical protein